MTEPATQGTGRGNGFGRKALTFAIVGVFNTAVDAMVFALLLSFAVSPLVANFFAWICGVSFSYQINSRWTFERSSEQKRLRAWMRFIATGGLVSLLCSTLIIGLTASVIGVWPAKALSVGIGAVLGFLAARWSLEGKLID